MKKRFIPATVAALALTFSAVAVPQAVAQEGLEGDPIVTVSQVGEDNVTLEPGARQWVSLSDIIDIVHWNEGNAPATPLSIQSVDFFEEDVAVEWLSYERDARRLVASPDAKAGQYDLTVRATVGSGADAETREGTLEVIVLGTALEGTAEILEANDFSQDSGFNIVRFDGDTQIQAVDEDGTVLVHAVQPDGSISITPGTDVDGPITLTVDDASLAEPLSETINIDGHAEGVDDNDSDVIISGTERTVEPAGTSQSTGLTIENHDEETGFSAVDEDNQNVPVTVNDDGLIHVTPGTSVDGPITLTITDSTLEGGSADYTIPVNGHTEGEDDNDSEVELPAFSGTAREVSPTNEAQDTGLNVANGTNDTEVTAKDADDEDVTVDVRDNGDIFVTPGEDVTGPITLTLTDELLEAPVTATVNVATPGDDNGSSLSSDLSSDNLGLILGGGVLVALIGVIAAIGGGFIQLPPALANLIPFL